MKLVFPSIQYKEQAIDYINEFYAYNSEIHGSGGLDHYLQEESYEAWLEKLKQDMDVANIPSGRVPALTYFYVRETDSRIVGMINLRLALNEFLATSGGHIGYSIRPTERRKHYGSMMLQEALRVYDILGIKKVIITCDKDNLGSSGVIKSCHGVLDEEFFSDIYQTVIERYIVNLK